MLETWLLTVFSPMSRERAICLFAPGQEPQHIRLALREGLVLSSLGGADLAHQSGGRLGRELHLAGCGRLQRPSKLFILGVLE